uniref:(California timema) hypothetical protein n=1 Tax=Timema californicum TaxID=61474 RepID=A0A7R9IXQ8_TIMCA|nr:unnamed protein product [Timema californicum]
MMCCCRVILLATWCLIVLLGMSRAVTLAHSPSSSARHQEHETQLATAEPGHRPSGVTSSELPKQIPAPPQPPRLSSTPQYHDLDEDQIPLFKLLWITGGYKDSYPDSEAKRRRNLAQRTDLLPNMV